MGTLEVLYEEVTGDTVKEIRLLSGPANITRTSQKEYGAFQKEMLSKRDVMVEWRVLPKKEAFKLHDRFFISEGISVNLPPLNTILAGSKGEILESELRAADFDEWWAKSEDLKLIDVEADNRSE